MSDRAYKSFPWGHVAEWLRNGLQNRVHRFNSGRGLHSYIIEISHFYYSPFVPVKRLCYRFATNPLLSLVSPVSFAIRNHDWALQPFLAQGKQSSAGRMGGVSLAWGGRVRNEYPSRMSAQNKPKLSVLRVIQPLKLTLAHLSDALT